MTGYLRTALSLLRSTMEVAFSLLFGLVGQILILLSFLVLLAIPFMTAADWTGINILIVAATLACHALGWYLYLQA